MARLVETIVRGPDGITDNTIRWEIGANRQKLPPNIIPTRIRLILKPVDDSLNLATIKIDTEPGESSTGKNYTLSTPGTNQHFRYDNTKAILTVDLGGEDSSDFSTGEYLCYLYWFDVNNPNSIKWSDDVVLVKIEDE